MSLWAKGSWVLWGYWGPLNFFPNMLGKKSGPPIAPKDPAPPGRVQEQDQGEGHVSTLVFQEQQVYKDIDKLMGSIINKDHYLLKQSKQNLCNIVVWHPPESQSKAGC